MGNDMLGAFSPSAGLDGADAGSAELGLISLAGPVVVAPGAAPSGEHAVLVVRSSPDSVDDEHAAAVVGGVTGVVGPAALPTAECPALQL